MSAKVISVKGLMHRSAAPARQMRELLVLLLLGISSTLSAVTQSPEEALRAFYQALHDQNCERAEQLWPRYSGCRHISDVKLKEVTQFYAAGDRAAIEYSVEFKKEGKSESFQGYVGMARQKEGWIHLHASAEPHVLGNRQEQLAYEEKLIKGDWDIGGTALESVAQLTVAPNSQLLHGSLKLLDACWHSKDFDPRTNEDLITPRRTPIIGPPNGVDSVWVEVSVDVGGDGPLGTIRWVKLAQEDRSVALTFNLIERSGELSGYDVPLVEELRRRNIPATFFATGEWMRSHPQRIQQLMANPLFEVGSLGWNHGNLAVLRGQQIDNQLIWAEAQYQDARAALANTDCSLDAGDGEMDMIAPTMTLFRFPYGRCDPESLEAAARYGLRLVQWSLVMDDIAVDANKESIVDRVMKNVHSGAIIVGHADGRGRFTVDALRELTPSLLLSGYSFVTVSQLLSKGEPQIATTCYEHEIGDNVEYDEKFGDGT